MQQKYPCIFLGGWGMPPVAYNTFLELLGKNGLKISQFDYAFFSKDVDPLRLPSADDVPASTSMPYILAAHSMGTPLAIELAAKRSCFSALILINPFLRFVKDRDFPGWEMKDLTAMKTNLRKNPESLLRAFYRNCASPEKFPMALPENLNPLALEDGLNYLAKSDVRKYASAVRCPVLILSSGEHDSIVPPAMSQTVDQYFPDGNTAVFESAGHLLPMVHAQECAKLIHAFVGECLEEK